MELDCADIHALQSSGHWIIKREMFLAEGHAAAIDIENLFLHHPEDFCVGSIGMKYNKVINPTFRSDKRCWLTPKFCKERNLTAINQLVKKLIGYCKTARTPLELNGDYSVQLACFPGDGTRYIRHRDTFLDTVGRPTSESRGASFRKLTIIYYINKTFDGGQLRIFSNSEGAASAVDIDPLLGTLVIFRSDLVEHEVLPSFQNRFAITIWASANIEKPLLPREHDLSWNIPLAIPTENDFSKDSIFISVPSFRDSEGPITLVDLFAKAQFPARVFVGFIVQADKVEDKDCFVSDSFLQKADIEFPGVGQWLCTNVRTSWYSPVVATGPCWARWAAQQLWREEKYYLQIDSHMRFRPNWDSYLISCIQLIKRDGYAKPIITTYPVGYEYPNRVPMQRKTTILVPSHYDSNHLLRQSAKLVTEAVSSRLLYLRSPLWAAGFSFSDSSFIKEVPYSPDLPFLFFGEELSMAARLFTNGYDFFSPMQSVVYHLYSRTHRPSYLESQISVDEQKSQRNQSIAVVQHMLGIMINHEISSAELLVKKNMASSWLGSTRSISQFQVSLKANFTDGLLDDKVDRVDECVPPNYKDQKPPISLSSQEISIEDILYQSLGNAQGTDGTLIAINAVLEKVNSYL